MASFNFKKINQFQCLSLPKWPNGLSTWNMKLSSVLCTSTTTRCDINDCGPLCRRRNLLKVQTLVGIYWTALAEDVCFAQFWARTVARWPVEPQIYPKSRFAYWAMCWDQGYSASSGRIAGRFQWIEWNAVRWRRSCSLKLQPTWLELITRRCGGFYWRMLVDLAKYFDVVEALWLEIDLMKFVVHWTESGALSLLIYSRNLILKWRGVFHSQIRFTHFKFWKRSLEFFQIFRIFLFFFPEFCWLYEDFINKKGF